PHMGALADLAAATHNISREEQDTYALASHARALQAQSEGHLASQLVAVSTSGAEFCSDEGVREPDLTKLAGLAPAFGANGTVTAGSASQIADGAAAVLLGSAAAGESHGLTPLARLAGIAVWSQEPRWYTTAPVGAIRKLLDGAGLRIAEIDRYEINEAFAVVPLYAMRELGIAHERVNVWGGAIAMGHPIGASGARIALNLAHALRATDGRYGIAAACNGGGEAVALLLETVQAP
ncbi:MAG TPA: thiolase family protein, partial [Dehalococcoidia bacterium]|nr:thiolase family protein [Dehalococcoidia bacterium]